MGLVVTNSEYLDRVARFEELLRPMVYGDCLFCEKYESEPHEDPCPLLRVFEDDPEMDEVQKGGFDAVG